MACPVCGCNSPACPQAHAVQVALEDNDLDLALARGLLDERLACTHCTARCQSLLQAAADARRKALAARERFSARQTRLAKRRQEREAKGKTATSTASEAGAPALPPAAAAALARAKAKAAGRSQP